MNMRFWFPHQLHWRQRISRIYQVNLPKKAPIGVMTYKKKKKEIKIVNAEFSNTFEKVFEKIFTVTNWKSFVFLMLRYTFSLCSSRINTSSLLDPSMLQNILRRGNIQLAHKEKGNKSLNSKMSIYSPKRSLFIVCNGI